MNCQELLDLLLDYVGGELIVETHRTVEAHLTGCPNCLTIVETYRHTIRFASALPKCGKLPEGVEERLRKFLDPHLNEKK
jgi:anti-sigma factor RsiW